MTTVKLVSYTKPTEEFEQDGLQDAQDLIAFCARVSNPNNQNNSKTAPQLLAYLIKHGHWSPFEMISLTMEIETTRDISHQIVRHRSFSFQEFSQRYAVSDTFEIRESRLQDAKNRQNSIELDYEDEYHRRINEDFSMSQHAVLQTARDAYEKALDAGIAKEQARAVLPEGMTGTTLYMAGTLRSWIHYCELRRSNGTQKEHSEIALACAEVINKIFPIGSEL